MKLTYDFEPCKWTIGIGWKWGWLFWVELPMLTVVLCGKDMVDTYEFVTREKP